MDLITFTTPAHIARVPRANRLEPFTTLCGVEFGPETRTRSITLRDLESAGTCVDCANAVVIGLWRTVNE